jgi:hypothetical protein
MSEPDYPPFVRELLVSCPISPTGVHQWLFKTARYLRRYHSDEEICGILKLGSAGCRRVVSEREIEDSVRNAGICKWERRGLSALERREERLKDPAASGTPFSHQSKGPL